MKKVISLALLVCLVCLFITGCASSTTTSSVVEYKITGTASKVSVTLNNASGGTEQFSDVSVPHTYTYNNYTYWFTYISAQNQGETGSITVSIYIDGELFQTSTSDGAYVIATASGER